MIYIVGVTSGKPLKYPYERSFRTDYEGKEISPDHELYEYAPTMYHVRIDTLQELHAFIDAVGRIIMADSQYIEVYDSYRE